MVLTVCAVLLAKDEADVIGYTVRYLLGQVDEVVVSDNGSTDGTREILDDIAREPAGRLSVLDDPDPAYYQAEKTTRLAHDAARRGHRWVIPCDADELWYATDGRRLADFLAGLAPDVAIATAELYNHLPTGADPLADPRDCHVCGGGIGMVPATPGQPGDGWEPCPRCADVDPNPFTRIGWRQREHGALQKVAARLRPGLEIRQGNHSAYIPGAGVACPGLCVRHFSWRTADQYERKLANGYRAYAATSLPEDVGAHWRMFGDPADPTFSDRVRAHFYEWFHVDDPRDHPELIYDPAPWHGMIELWDEIYDPAPRLAAVSDGRGNVPRDGVGSPEPLTPKGDPMDEHEDAASGQDEPEAAAEPPAPPWRTLREIRDDLEAALFAVQDLAKRDMSDESERYHAILEMKIEDAFLWAREAAGV